MATRQFRTLATETLDRLSRTGIREISQAADNLKSSIKREQPQGTPPHPLWPHHEGIFGASDASRHEPNPSLLATDDESENFSRSMKHKTHTKPTPPPYLELATRLNNDATNIKQTLKDTEEQGKDTPVLLWIYYHEGVDYTERMLEKTTPPRMVPLQSIPNDNRNQEK
jgi:hypothetical protein